MPRIRVLLAVTLLVVSCASCSEDPGDAQPGGSPKASTSTPAAPTPPTPTVPPYLASYTADERQAYAEAAASYEVYIKRNNRLLAQGKTTVSANDFYQRYSTDWVAAWANLGKLANNNVRVTGVATVKWVMPASVMLKRKGVANIVLRRCLDESKLVVTQNDRPLDQPNLKNPHVYRVLMEKRAGETWWRFGSAEQGAPC